MGAKKQKVETVDDISVSVVQLQNDLGNVRSDLAALHKEFEQFRANTEAILSVMEGRMIVFNDAVQGLTRKTMKWCVVCFERENDYAFLPCRHKCVCRQCAKEVTQQFKQCPICRRTVEAICKIHDLSAWDNKN